MNMSMLEEELEREKVSKKNCLFFGLKLRDQRWSKISIDFLKMIWHKWPYQNWVKQPNFILALGMPLLVYCH